MTSRRSGRPPERAGGDALAALRLVTAALADRKALDPMVLDLRGLTAAADYFVIVSGTSDAHVRGMAEHLMEALAPRGVAGSAVLRKEQSPVPGLRFQDHPDRALRGLLLSGRADGGLGRRAYGRAVVRPPVPHPAPPVPGPEADHLVRLSRISS